MSTSTTIPLSATALASAVSAGASVPGSADSATSGPAGSLNTAVSAASPATAVPGAVSTLLANISNYQFNPAMIQQSVMQTLTDVTNGTISVVDPTNPFVFCLESSAVCTAGFMVANEATTRRQYPYAAQTPEDLYYHMSDVDYIGRFSSPSTTMFSLLLPYDEVINKMVLDPTTGIRKIVIPRNTYFTVAGTNFSLQYPIEIRQMPHGGLQVVYDTSVVSPLQQLSTNVINYQIRSGTGAGNYIYFEFDVQQFDIISQQGTLNAATDFSIDIPLNNQFYYARVYVEDPNTGLWTEINTTHSAQVYDINTPTATLEVVTDTSTTLTVTIPQIYTSTSLLEMGVRIDVYETIGPLNMLLFEYPFNAFAATWVAYDDNDYTVYTAPLATFRTIIPFSNNTVSGGSNALTFDQLRQQVISNNIGTASIPITNVSINSALNQLGYSVVTNIDNITNRAFLATKPMPSPTDPNLLTPAGSSIETVLVSISALTALTSVVDNGLSVTITPDTIYQNINGIVAPVTSAKVAALLALPPSQLALAVTNGNYLYTPFHYVLDMTGNQFAVRPYYLDNPVIESKLFVNENVTSLLQVATGTYAITRTATGFQIQVVTQSSAAYQALPDNEVFAQLSYTPVGETSTAYLIGVQAGTTAAGERIYNFDLSTTFNLDSSDDIELTKFFMFNTAARTVLAALTTTFDLIYATTAPLGSQFVSGPIDQELSNFLLPTGVQGVSHEQLMVEFGFSLSTLWARARSVVSAQPYQTYPAAVPLTYAQNVYQTDSTGSAITIVNGVVTTNILHAAGDPVLDAGGNPVYMYNAGDVVVDTNSAPIPLGPRTIDRVLDILMIEGPYWFANDPITTAYRATLTEVVVSWLTNDLALLSTQLLEQTRIYFYPETTLGSISVSLGNNTTTTIEASQKLVLNLSVPAVVYNNSELCDRLTVTSVNIIGQQLQQSTISVDAITTALRASYGDDVVSVQLLGLGGSNNLQAFTVIDAGSSCSIAKQLVAQPDNTLIVSENVTVNFTNFDVTS